MCEITIKKNVHEHNQRRADENRHRFHHAGLLTINILGSPGSGKTSLIEQTIQRLSSPLKMIVIEGDVETERDADRIRALGVEAIQIQTHGACHLDAAMVSDSLGRITLDKSELLIIENVGNLICPAAFDLGEDIRVVVGSTTEGDDKPIKYPEMYYNADACVLNKTDLLPYINFNREIFETGARRPNNKLQFFPRACTTGEGFDQWISWLQEKLTHRSR